MGAWIFAPKYAFVNPYFLITSYLSKSLEFLYLSLFSLISILSLSSLWVSFLHELHFCFKWKTFHAVSCYMCSASKKFSTVWKNQGWGMNFFNHSSTQIWQWFLRYDFIWQISAQCHRQNVLRHIIWC